MDRRDYFSDKPLRKWTREELEDASNKARMYYGSMGGAGGGGPQIPPEFYESELSRRETIRLGKWMTIAVVCNAVFIAADIVFRWLFRII